MLNISERSLVLHAELLVDSVTTVGHIYISYKRRSKLTYLGEHFLKRVKRAIICFLLLIHCGLVHLKNPTEGLHGGAVTGHNALQGSPTWEGSGIVSGDLPGSTVHSCVCDLGLVKATGRL